MNRTLIRCKPKKSEKGVALVVSLILLTVVTLLSLTAMRNANLGTRIAINHQHKQFAFQAAENALAKLTNLQADEMKNLDVPGSVAADPVSNTDWYVANVSENDAKASADLTMDLVEISRPGQYKFSGYGLNVVTVIYQADAVGEVAGSNATAHNRMQVALIRD